MIRCHRGTQDGVEVFVVDLLPLVADGLGGFDRGRDVAVVRRRRPLQELTLFKPENAADTPNRRVYVR